MAILHYNMAMDMDMDSGDVHIILSWKDNDDEDD